MFKKKQGKLKYKFSYGKSPKSNKARGFQQRQKPKRAISLRLIKLFKLILYLSLAATIIYSLFFSSYFKLKTISFSDTSFEKETLTNQLTETIKDSLNQNLVFLDTEELKLEIINDFPQLEEVNIEKDYPNTIIINFSEYPQIANIINESSTLKKSYIINSIGFAVKEDFENPSLPYIRLQTDEPINPQSPIIEKNKLDYILNSISYFQDKFGMNINEANYNPIARELHLLTEKNFSIWLDIQISFEDQFKKLKKALVKLDIYNDPLEYIDLRIAGNNGDKIIYKRSITQ